MRVGSKEIQISNWDKVLFPETGITKGDIIEYYRDISVHILPHLRHRPLSMHRFPDGLAGDDFYQKQKPDHFPEWINEIEVHKKGNGKNVQISCDSKPALIYLANQACIVLHTWLSREDDLHRPDRISFDLDPPDEEFDDVVFAAFRLKKLLDEI